MAAGPAGAQSLQVRGLTRAALGTQPRFLLGSEGLEGAQLFWEVLEGEGIVPQGQGRREQERHTWQWQGTDRGWGTSPAQAGLAAVMAGGPLCCGRRL